jgi:hypothetical protein
MQKGNRWYTHNDYVFFLRGTENSRFLDSFEEAVKAAIILFGLCITGSCNNTDFGTMAH